MRSLNEVDRHPGEAEELAAAASIAGEQTPGGESEGYW